MKIPKLTLFFDTEFTGLKKDTTLVSIGMVAEIRPNGFNDEKWETPEVYKFYGELTDYDKTYDDPWFKKNVISQLVQTTNDSSYYEDENTTLIVGTKNKVKQELLHWIQKMYDLANCETVGDNMLVSDVCHYDMVLLIDLLADNALSLPNYIPATCYDINSLIAIIANEVTLPILYEDCESKELSVSQAFDINREEIIYQFSELTENNSTLNKKYLVLKENAKYFLTRIKYDIECDRIKNSNYKHNSLYDAEVIKAIFWILCLIPCVNL